MPRPIVEIHQELLNAVLVPADPTQRVCIVGPSYFIKRYPQDSAAVDHRYDPLKNIAILGAGLVTALGEVNDAISGYPGSELAPDLTSAYKPSVHLKKVRFHVVEEAG